MRRRKTSKAELRQIAALERLLALDKRGKRGRKPVQRTVRRKWCSETLRNGYRCKRSAAVRGFCLTCYQRIRKRERVAVKKAALGGAVGATKGQ